MSLHDFLTVIRKRWVWVLIPVLVLGGLVTALSERATPLYRGTASMYVALSAGNTASDLNQGSTFTQSQMTSFASLATLPIVTGPVVQKLGLDEQPRQFAGSVSAATPQGTAILSVSVTSTSPERAAAAANAVASQLATVIEGLAPTGSDGSSTIKATVVDEAVPSSHPISPRTKRNVVGALFAGLVIGLLLAYLREMLDTRVRRPEDVTAAIDVPMLGTVRAVRRVHDVSPLTAATVGGQAEDLRRVRTNLQMIGKVGRFKSFVISSAIASEGKTHVAVRVAAAFAAAGDRTLLIDADLRRPTVADELGLEGAVGLTECLVGRSALADVVQPAGPNLVVLPSGAIPPNPNELLSSREFEELLETARGEYDTVVIDAPPLLPVSDGVLISRLTTGLILVVDASRTRRAQIRHAVESVRLGGGRVSGVVLNKSKAPSEESYTYSTTSRRSRRRRGRPAAPPAAVLPDTTPAVPHARRATRTHAEGDAGRRAVPAAPGAPVALAPSADAAAAAQAPGPAGPGAPVALAPSPVPDAHAPAVAPDSEPAPSRDLDAAAAAPAPDAATSELAPAPAPRLAASAEVPDGLVTDAETRAPAGEPADASATAPATVLQTGAPPDGVVPRVRPSSEVPEAQRTVPAQPDGPVVPSDVG